MSQPKTTRLRLALAGVALLTACPLLAGAELRVSVGNADGANSQEVAIPVSVKGAQNLVAIQMRLSYDPAVLAPKVDPKNEDMVKCAQVDGGPLVKGADIESEIGEGGMGLGMVTTEFIQGDGVILKPVFVVHGQVGQKSPLKLESVRAWEGKNLQELVVTTEDGEFTVGSAAWPWTLTAIVAGAVLALILLTMIVLRLRRRRPQAALAAASPTVAPAPPPVVAPPVVQPSGERPPRFLPEGLPFQHRCTKCGGVVKLPAEMAGREFECGACGTVQVAGR